MGYKMDCGMSFVKFIVFIFNLICALGGLALLVLGALIKVQMKVALDLMDNYKFSAPAIVLIVIGSIIFVIAFLGCCGAAKDSHCMLITYSVLLCSIFIVEVVIAALAFVYRKDMENVLDKTVLDVFDEYKNNGDDADLVDSIQSTLQCCGVDGPLYWIPQKFPGSCCGANKNVICVTPYQKGCLPALKDFTSWSGNVLGGVALGVAAVELVGIIFSCCLANTIKNEERRRAV